MRPTEIILKNVWGPLVLQELREWVERYRIRTVNNAVIKGQFVTSSKTKHRLNDHSKKTLTAHFGVEVSQTTEVFRNEVR